MVEGELEAMTLFVGNHFYTVDFLDMAAELLTPYHIAKKKIPCIDETGEDPFSTTPPLSSPRPTRHPASKQRHQARAIHL